MDDLKKELEYRTEPAPVTNIIHSAPCTDTLLAEAQDQICDLLDAERITISASDPQTNRLRSLHGSGGEGLRSEHHVSRQDIGEAVSDLHGGYRGRVALQEFLSGGDRLRGAIQERATADQPRDIGESGGMTTLLQDGIQEVFGGRTDLEQVRAVCLR